MTKSSSKLSHEDRILWDRVARTTTPLRGRERKPLPDPGPERALDRARPSARPPAQPAPAKEPPRSATAAHKAPNVLDRASRTRLAKERLPLEARIDLHGLVQSEAYSLLLSFLQRAALRGMRHVLVITGKGLSQDSQGVLNRVVPGWLATAPFRTLVGGFEHAARRHGGAGALYVRLKRLSEHRPR